MKHIAQSLVLPNAQILKNRLVKSAMSEALADKNNNPSQELIDLFALWGKSGAALLITGNTPIDRMHLEHARNMVLDQNTDLTKVATLVKAAKSGGAKVMAQLCHAGRQTPESITPEPISISDVPLDLSGYGTPKAATEAILMDTIAQFAASAKLAQDAGFDGVEIHAAHGYLLSSSLSPRINTRKDCWGGTLKNRARLLCEVVKAVRETVEPNFIVAVKLNSSDFQKGGFDNTESAQVAAMLETEKVDFIEISGGTFEAPTAYQYSAKKDSTIAREAYFLDYAIAIKHALNIPLMVTGGFRSDHIMNDAIQDQKTDLIGLGRPFIIDPAFPNALLAGEIQQAPAVEQTFPAAETLPRGAGLNWFCTQLTRLARTGKADLSLPIIQGHEEYLQKIKLYEKE